MEFKNRYLNYLRCIHCSGEETLIIEGDQKSHIIRCRDCKASYPIINNIPRFVESEVYSKSFVFQWNTHSTTQFDQSSGLKLSEERFFKETGWNRDLSQQILIEAGCGSGRFTEWALSTGALVLSFDLSNAVEVNMRQNGSHPNLLLVQADLFNIPFKKEVADKLFCFGVLQHTPSPKKALYSLIPFVKKNGGEIVFDIYRKKIHMKYLIRPFAKRIPPQFLYRLCKNWIDMMWPIATMLRKLSPRYGPKINWNLMIADHSREGVPEEKLKEWSYLDTFDMLSPQFDKVATLNEVGRWLLELKKDGRIKDYTVQYGYNGIQGKIYR